MVKNSTYTFLANLVSILISLITTLIFPRYFGVEEFGYWQLYVFYTSYTVFSDLGVCCGILLKYAGKQEKELDKKVIASQFWTLNIYITTLFFFLGSACLLLGIGADNKFIVITICIYGILIIPRFFVIYLFQATYQINKYVIITILDRSIFIVFAFLGMIIGDKRYEVLIFADLTAKLATLILGLLFSRDMLFHRLNFDYQCRSELYDNIKSGSKLLLASITGQLVLGIIRFSIQDIWDISTFGKVSLTLSISNLLITFIGGISEVLFPILRRVSKNKLAGYYKHMRVLILTPTFGLLLFYVPIKEILNAWLPQYSDGLKYMALLFPICIFAVKNDILVAIYQKVLRQEKTMLLVNCITVVLSGLSTSVFAYLLKNLTITIISIVGIFAFRAFLSETLLLKSFGIRLKAEPIIELLIVFIFIYLNWFNYGMISMLGYFIVYVLYLFYKSREIKFSFAILKSK